MLSTFTKSVTIGIVGGSIAGLAAARSLIINKGMKVAVFEANSSRPQNQGAGIGLPKALFNNAIQLGLLGTDFPVYPISSRTLSTYNSNFPFGHRPLIPNQPFQMMGTNWQHLYQHLKQSIPPEVYKSGCRVIGCSQNDNCAVIETSSEKHEFDYVIGADGINSVVRQSLFPELKPQYANYIAWRGICESQELVSDLEGGMVLYDRGHIIIYKIPAHDFPSTGRFVLNWVLYEHNPSVSIRELLTDKNGKCRDYSVPKGFMKDEQIQHIRSLAHSVLPPNIARMVLETPEPFSQAIFDLSVPAPVNGRIILIGDASTCLRPHVGAGAGQAIESAIGLADVLALGSDNCPNALSLWSKEQSAKTKQLIDLAQRLGNELVISPPDWSTMSSSQAQEWWGSVMSGKKWYPVDQSPDRLFSLDNPRGNGPTETVPGLKMS